jgi:hypothetical protein
MATVRKRPKVAKITQPQNIYNALSDYAAWTAKTGATAEDGAREIENENKAKRESGKKPKTVKVNSNPVKGGVTRIGRMSGGGAGGMFGIKNR